MPGTRVYVSNAETKDISVFGMDRETGALSLIETVPVPGTDVPSPSSLPMAISPDHRYLHAALRSPPYPASTYAIDPSDGRLTHLGQAPLVAAMAYIVTDRTGRYLLCASYGDATLATYPIDPDGRIEPRATQLMQTGPKAHCVVVDAANRFAYCAVLGADHIMQLVFDPASGKLSPNTPPSISTRPQAGPRHIAFHPTGQFLYLLNELDGTINTYSIDPHSGVLAEIGMVATLPADPAGEAKAADVHVTPDGRFLYASKRRTSTIAGFLINPATGLLSSIGHWQTETTPRGFAIDPRGRFLIAAGLDSNSISVHAIEPGTGLLQLRSRHPVGAKPNWVEILDLPQP